MKKSPSRSALAAVSVACLFILAACNSGGPSLRYITISPKTATVAVAATQQYTALAYYSDGTVKDGTGLVSWSSSNTAVATINGSGLATGVTAGTVTITGSAASTSGDAATLTVSQPFTSIVVNCTPNPVGKGGTSKCTALGNPGATDITTQVAWSSSDTTKATIPASVSTSPAGATAIAPGTTTITATLGGLSNDFTLTVTGPVVDGLAVTPANPTAAKGNTVAFVALEHFTDGSTGPLTGIVTWNSGNTTVASIVSTATNGIGATTVLASTGTSVITATEGSLTGTSTLTAANPVAHYAYVGNGSDSTISGYGVTASAGTLTPLLGATGNPWVATAPEQVIVHPSGKYLYCICGQDATHTAAVVFDITDPTTGALSAPVTTPPSGFSFSAVVGTGGYNKGVIDPTGQFLFVLDSANTVAGYTINQADGSLSSAAINTLPTGDFPFDILIAKNATGTYVYVVNSGLQTAQSQASVSGYSIDATGTLTALNSGTPFANGVADPLSYGSYGTVDPNNAFLYVANGPPDNAVTVFKIAGNGNLSAITGSPFAIAGASILTSVAVDPTDKYLYAVDSPASPANGSVYAYNIVSGGGISATPSITNSPYAVGVFPIGISIDPSGTFLAVVNNDDTVSSISQFKLAPSTGVLTPVLPDAPAGNNAQFLAFWVGP